MDISLVNLVSDSAFVAILLLVGVALRAHILWVQKLFLPASIIAGLLALLLGPNGLSWLPLSSNIAQYPGILITFIFGSLALNSGKFKFSTAVKRAGNMWSYSAIGMIGMYSGGVFLTLLILQRIWPDIPDGFGLLLAAGFIGGHGTAAAVGGIFESNGWAGATSLAMTSATIGVLVSILGGVWIIRQNVKRGKSNFISDFDSLSVELRTGLVPDEKRVKTDLETVSSMTIDPLLFHGVMVLIVSGLSFWCQAAIKEVFDFPAPTFALAFIIGLVVNALLSKLKVKPYINPSVINSIGGASTDMLVVFGIASINLAVAGQYFAPLALLMVFGVWFSYVMLKYISPKFYAQFCFEKSIFGWGWFTGTVAMGIALLRIVDPKSESKTLDEFGFAYIMTAPLEMMVITMSPLILLSGGGWLYVGGCFLTCAIIYVVCTVLNRKNAVFKEASK